MPDKALIQKLKSVKSANIDLVVVEPILDYAASVIEHQIRLLRETLSKIAEPSLRHEYLARLEALQVVKSKLSITELAQQIGKLEEEELKLNVY